MSPHFKKLTGYALVTFPLFEKHFHFFLYFPFLEGSYRNFPL